MKCRCGKRLNHKDYC